MTTPMTLESLRFWRREPRRRYLDGALFVIQRRRRPSLEPGPPRTGKLEDSR